MPGLAGLVSVGHDDIAGIAFSMASRLGLGVPPASIDLASAQGAAMAADSRPAGLWGPKVASDGQGLVVGINGEVFGLFKGEGNETADLLRGPRSRPAEDLLALYRRSGPACVGRLRGFFSLAIWDGARETLVLATDHFAMRPLFYLQEGKSVLFASEVKAILAASGGSLQQDEHGIADYLLLGMPLGDRTLFKGIRLVPPASILEIGGGRSAARSYWQLRFHSGRDTIGDLEKATELFSEAFDSAVGDCVDEGGVFELPLSGGMDSRCIGAVASRKAALRSYTMGGYESEDLKIGPRVAQRLGIPNLASSLTAKDFIDWTAASVYITDGMYSPVNALIMAVARRLPGDARVVLDGANSFDGHYRALDLFMRRPVQGRKGLVATGIGICPQPVIDARMRVRAPVLSRDFISSGRAQLESTYSEFADAVPEDQRGDPFATTDFLDLSNRLRRFNMMGTVLLRAFCEVRQPLFDFRIVEVATHLPPLLRSREKLFMGHYLSRLDPALAALPYERSGLPADAGLNRQILEYARRAARKAASCVAPRLREKPRVPVNYMHWIKSDSRLQQYLNDLLLDPRSLRRGHVTAPAMEPFLKELYSGRAENLYLAMRLVSIEIWYRYFIEKEPAPTYPPH